MIDKLHQFYASKDQKSFRLGTSILFFLTDIVVLTYLYFKFSDPELFNSSLKLGVELQGMSLNDFDQDFTRNLYLMFHRTLVMVLLLVGFAHSFVYVFWNKGRRFAIVYIKMLSAIGGPLLILWGLSILSYKVAWALSFIALGALIFATLPGIRFFENKKSPPN